MRIHKYVLRPDEGDSYDEASGSAAFRSTVYMEAPGEVISVEVTSQGPALYATADPESEKQERGFFVVGNGIDLPEGEVGQHVGTAKIVGGSTFHVFELLPVPVGA